MRELFLEKRKVRDIKKNWMGLEEKSILWIFGYCWFFIFVLRIL